VRRMSGRVPRMVIPARSAISVCLLAICAAGCSKAARVTGTVTLDEKPLPAGRVTFLCDGGKRPALSSPIKDGGLYELANPPEGPGEQTFDIRLTR